MHRPYAMTLGWQVSGDQIQSYLLLAYSCGHSKKQVEASAAIDLYLHYGEDGCDTIGRLAAIKAG